MPTKDELVEDAVENSVPDAEHKTKPELEEALAARAPEELGPVIPDGETAPEIAAPSGTPTKGVQPYTEDDIPEAGR